MCLKGHEEAQMTDDGDAEKTLFQSLLRALQREDGDGQRTELSQVDEALRRELDDWWSCAPFGVSAGELQRQEYERFYCSLAEAVHKAELLPAVRHDQLSLSAWVEHDWAHDQHVLQRTSGEPFVESIFRIAQTTVNPPTDSDTGAAQIMLTVRRLREVCSTAKIPQPAASAKPQTMAEKLAHMRTRRTALVNDGSVARLVPPTETVQATEGSLAPTEAALTSSISPFSSLGGEDDAARYFTIETRLELKEKLVVLQSRLDGLLLQAKLAWMKCFSSMDDSLDGMQSETAVESATQLVEQGEALASHLLDAFQKARKTTCPINEYKALVTTCELEFEAFEKLVASLAAAPSPTRTKMTDSPQKLAETQEIQRPEPVHKPTPASFDLPSMKAYYEKAAPSYTAYLPPKKR